jgi:eukaryotic-like serine/threonine-protein kinase
MEFVPGQTLDARLAAGPLSTADALRLASEVAEAIEEAHSKRFIHRDLKPSNIMLTPQGRVKVMDFGLAKRIGDTPVPMDDRTMSTELTMHGVVLGTPSYMAPEQVRDEPLDQRSDLFSFGILLCEMLGSPHPFRKASSAETMAAILREPPNLAGDLLPGLMVLIRRLLAKAPADRYQGMGRPPRGSRCSNTRARSRRQTHSARRWVKPRPRLPD